ncbi:hypothetical protein TgHK011_002195 [Trichoderma gracile]|nr:hypothetical protein TgHK011_002195 [Trichoderma gracile]
MEEAIGSMAVKWPAFLRVYYALEVIKMLIEMIDALSAFTKPWATGAGQPGVFARRMIASPRAMLGGLGRTRLVFWRKSGADLKSISKHSLEESEPALDFGYRV